MKTFHQYLIAVLIMLTSLLSHAQNSRLTVVESHESTKNSQIVVVTVRIPTATIVMGCEKGLTCRMPIAGETGRYDISNGGVYIGTNVNVVWADGTLSGYSVVSSRGR
jgi:hypothetical protein